jgi:uncharacterized protein YlxP (DUF503 family)
MHIGLLQLDLHLPYAHSLKDKRMAIRKLKDRLRNRFNVSVSELNHQELWQRSQVGVVSIGPDPSYLERQLSLALEEAERVLPDCTIQGDIEFL